jgi:hypothetical protein
MRNTFSQAIKIVFSPEAILPFLVGSISLSIFGNAIYDVIKNTFGVATPSLIKIAFIALFTFISAIALVAFSIQQALSRLPFRVPIEVRQKAMDQKYPGLILLVSNPEACETAIRYHGRRLQQCWLICSAQTLEQAQAIARQHPRVCPDNPIVINDIYNPIEFRNCIDTIYRTRLPDGWQASDVIVDYTGMTAHASVGAVLACWGSDRPLQYTPAQIDSNGKAIGSLSPIKVILDF